MFVEIIAYSASVRAEKKASSFFKEDLHDIHIVRKDRITIPFLDDIVHSPGKDHEIFQSFVLSYYVDHKRPPFKTMELYQLEKPNKNCIRKS